MDHLFKYKGNAKITKRQRGRVRDALPALQVMYGKVSVNNYTLVYKKCLQ